MIVGGGGGKDDTRHADSAGGALKPRTRGLLISLDERPARIIRNARTLGLNLEELVADGTIQTLYESPRELLMRTMLASSNSSRNATYQEW
jgi:circadian clock protein KaiC